MNSFVLIGRPNVGKSSLYNTLLGYRRSIVLDMPGTTMDLVREKVRWAPLTLVDSQGIFDEGDSETLQEVLRAATVCLFVVDGQVGITPFDKWLAKEIHISKKPTLLLINKCDGLRPGAEDEFGELGFLESMEVSAAHRRGIDDLKGWCRAKIEVGVTEDTTPPKEDGPIKLALIGRPNSGKSTLMNKLCRQKISRVSPIPHTTRDPVSFEIETKEGIVKLIDTAGIRRPRSKKESVEQFSIHASTRSLKEADIVFLLINCSEAITDQDMRLLSLVERERKPAVVLLNFWDKLSGSERRHFVENSDFSNYLKNFKTLNVSGKTGWNVDRLMSLVFKLHEGANKRVKTSELNRFVKDVVGKNPPPAAGNGNFNILYASQVKTSPPTFVFFMNRKGNLPESYQRYLENQIKNRLGFRSQPVKIHFRAGERH